MLNERADYKYIKLHEEFSASQLASLIKCCNWSSTGLFQASFTSVTSLVSHFVSPNSCRRAPVDDSVLSLPLLFSGVIHRLDCWSAWCIKGVSVLQLKTTYESISSVWSNKNHLQVRKKKYHVSDEDGAVLQSNICTIHFISEGRIHFQTIFFVVRNKIPLSLR